ncbi:four helix bundle protein [Chitinophaga niastensis]|uniref:Four helix bundle protein n=1 Tax=Chitinophaga niastensis TaxID=536980 RepID=A0A2P8HV09_CHINA|nr:four helix bundle protein [Chitinophaga niastensis]PSL50048.1 four helix bundle protein [Chitinophaga niastensis]
MRNFRSLVVWQKSLELSVKVYELTKLFPSEEKFGLISQLRRAAVSITSNIAEGAAKSSDLYFKKFLEDAIGSAFEMESQLLISCKIYPDLEKSITEILFPLMIEVQKMLNSMIGKLKSQSLEAPLKTNS